MARAANRRWSPVFVVVCAFLVWMGAAARAQERPSKTVLTIHSGEEFFPTNPVLDSAIRGVLGAGETVTVDYHAEYLESIRFGTADASDALAEYIRRKFRNRQIDLVIAIVNDSLRFVLDHRELFPHAPIVFAGVAGADELARRKTDGLVAAVRVGSAYAQTLKLALDLHPSTARVFVVAGSPVAAEIEAVKAEFAGFPGGVPVSYINAATLTQLREAVNAVPPNSVILHLWHRNGEPTVVDPRDVARLVAQTAAVPVYGTVDINVGTGIVGGVVRGVHEMGTRLGELALDILEGRALPELIVEDAPLVPTFDGRQLTRWGIARSALPAASRILFSPPTVWESYRAYIIAITVVVAAQLLAIAGLLVQHARRRRAEETVLAREATIRASYDRIRQLAGRLITAQETVRAGIARDLHDGVCQELAGVSIAISTLKQSTGSIQDPQSQETLAQVCDETLSMFEGVRRLSHDLHPATLQLLGLAAALEAHCAEVEKRHGVEVRYTSEGPLEDVTPDAALCFFRIAQESLRNGVVHGRSRRLSVALSRSNGQVDLTVTDDGCGFDLERARGTGGGLGLVSIEERAHMIGGEVTIVSAVGHGTTIHVRAPADSGGRLQ